MDVFLVRSSSKEDEEGGFQAQNKGDDKRGVENEQAAEKEGAEEEQAAGREEGHVRDHLSGQKSVG